MISHVGALYVETKYAIMQDIRHNLNIIEATTRPSKLETTPLPYGHKDLEPVMSAATLEYHYENLAKGYAKRYNAGEGNADFNRAGSFLHNMFFPQFRAPKSPNRPRGSRLQIIEMKFKDAGYKTLVAVTHIKELQEVRVGGGGVLGCVSQPVLEAE